MQIVFIHDTTTFDAPVWLAFYGCYMYGPWPTLEQVLYDIYDSWEHDRNLIG